MNVEVLSDYVVIGSVRHCGLTYYNLRRDIAITLPDGNKHHSYLTFRYNGSSIIEPEPSWFEQFNRIFFDELAIGVI